MRPTIEPRKLRDIRSAAIKRSAYSSSSLEPG